jgi:hypothetical protein
MIKNINLQLFAEGEVEENANLENQGALENNNAENNGDQQPEINATPEEQSKDKDNPANHAFAEMRRQKKELETQLKAIQEKQKQTDEYYASLAKAKGRNDISTADDYFKALRAEELAEQYQKTQDPLVLAQLLKENILNDPRMSKTQAPQQTSAELFLSKEVEDFNREFKQNLKDYGEIPSLPNSNKIIDYMENNSLSLIDAYKLANPDKILAASKQAAINEAKGLTHVKPNSNNGSVSEVQVTAAEIANWKRWFPGRSDEQCRKEIAASKKVIVD